MNPLTQAEQSIPEEQLPNNKETQSLENLNAVLSELIKTKLPPTLDTE
ncbi:MAG: hypothetical protein ABII80_01685 [bacterium]